MKKVRVAVTGGAGNICYSLLFRIASGELFGPSTLVDLFLIEISSSVPLLKGVEMELNDCAFPLLSSLTITDSLDEGLDGMDFVFLVGAKPRSKGMERLDLLKENGKIFVSQGKALTRSKNAKVLVVGNPCNTNALILKHAARDVDPKNIRAMTRLDQNRATALIADKSNASIDEVHNVGIFGNHSSTMVVDYLHASIKGKKVIDCIDLSWLQGYLFSKVSKRGAEIIEARGSSSAASAASAALDSMKDWINLIGDTVASAGVYTSGNPYGIAEDLYFSFPLIKGKIVEDLKMDEFLDVKIKESEKELLVERDQIREFLS